MTHPTEEDMVDGYYAGLNADLQHHLAACSECSALYKKICETLETASEARIPERGAEYGAQVWTRISAQLPSKPARTVRWLVPAFAALLALASLGGLWIQQALRPLPPPTLATARIPAPVMPTLAQVNIAKRPKLRVVQVRVPNLPKPAAPPRVELAEGDVIEIPKPQALRVLAHGNEAGAQTVTIAVRNDADLLNFLKRQPDPKMRVATIRSLAVIGNRSEALINTYRSDDNVEVRQAVLDVLLTQRNGEALSTLAKHEFDPHWTKEIQNRLTAIKTIKVITTTSSPEP